MDRLPNLRLLCSVHNRLLKVLYLVQECRLGAVYIGILEGEISAKNRKFLTTLEKSQPRYCREHVLVQIGTDSWDFSLDYGAPYEYFVLIFLIRAVSDNAQRVGYFT